jgi:hypothetical protein
MEQVSMSVGCMPPTPERKEERMWKGHEPSGLRAGVVALCVSALVVAPVSGSPARKDEIAFHAVAERDFAYSALAVGARDPFKRAADLIKGTPAPIMARRARPYPLAAPLLRGNDGDALVTARKRSEPAAPTPVSVDDSDDRLLYGRMQLLRLPSRENRQPLGGKCVLAGGGMGLSGDVDPDRVLTSFSSLRRLQAERFLDAQRSPVGFFQPQPGLGETRQSPLSLELRLSYRVGRYTLGDQAEDRSFDGLGFLVPTEKQFRTTHQSYEGLGQLAYDVTDCLDSASACAAPWSAIESTGRIPIWAAPPR